MRSKPGDWRQMRQKAINVVQNELFLKSNNCNRFEQLDNQKAYPIVLMQTEHLEFLASLLGAAYAAEAHCSSECGASLDLCLESHFRELSLDSELAVALHSARPLVTLELDVRVK